MSIFKFSSDSVGQCFLASVFRLINLGCNYSYSLAGFILWNMRYHYIRFYFLWLEYDIYYNDIFLLISQLLFSSKISHVALGSLISIVLRKGKRICSYSTGQI